MSGDDTIARPANPPLRFLRAVRLDASDTQIYDHVAEPGEWAVPGSFVLWDLEPTRAEGGAREAFRHGFVGAESFGSTTLVITAEIEPEELAQVTGNITAHLMSRYGAPNEDAAREVAEQEVRFTQELAEHPAGTLIAVEREEGPDGIEERFKTVMVPDGSDHGKVKLWELVDED